MCGPIPYPVVDTTNGGLKCFVVVSVKISGVEGPSCWSSTTLWVVTVLLLTLGSAELVE